MPSSCHNLSEITKSGLTMTSANFLSSRGYMSLGPIVLCRPDLLKYSLLRSFFTKGKSFLLQTSPLVSGTWDCWGKSSVQYLGLLHVFCHQVHCPAQLWGHIFLRLPLSAHVLVEDLCSSHPSTDSAPGGLWFSLPHPFTLEQCQCVLPGSPGPASTYLTLPFYVYI